MIVSSFSNEVQDISASFCPVIVVTMLSMDHALQLYDMCVQEIIVIICHEILCLFLWIKPEILKINIWSLKSMCITLSKSPWGGVLGISFP